MNKFILITFAVLFVAITFQSRSNAQQWNKNTEISSLPFIQFSWRNIETDDGAMIEWSFSNTSDSLVEFSYTLKTELKETFQGRIQILPHRYKLCGWVLQGKSIVTVTVDNTSIQPIERSRRAPGN